MWFTTKVRYEKTRENGSLKTITEPYLVDALSFTEAEARITNEMMPYTSGAFSVSAVNLNQAAKNLAEGMRGTVSDYEVASIVKTPIVDAYKIAEK